MKVRTLALAIEFHTAASAGSSTERMRIDSSGVVGIGLVPSGTEKLQVSGQIKASQDGSASAPAFVINDGDTGFYRAANNTMGFTTGGSERARINSLGDLLVACTSTDSNSSSGVRMFSTGSIHATRTNEYAAVFRRSSSDGGVVLFRRDANNVGGINVTSSSTSYATSSDHRLKENVADMTGAIDRVKALAPKRFNFIVDADTTVDGFLAHEAQTVVPEAVIGTHNEVETWTQQQIDDGDAPDGTSAGDNKLDEDGNTIPVYQGIDQAKLVPLLTAALKESITKIETLETEMTALKARVTTLEGE